MRFRVRSLRRMRRRVIVRRIWSYDYDEVDDAHIDVFDASSI